MYADAQLIDSAAPLPPSQPSAGTTQPKEDKEPAGQPVGKAAPEPPAPPKAAEVSGSVSQPDESVKVLKEEPRKEPKPSAKEIEKDKQVPAAPWPAAGARNETRVRGQTRLVILVLTIHPCNRSK